MNPNVNARDALVLAIRTGDAPELVWRTAFGGTRSERGWGIAGSPVQGGEVYLAGGTASQAFQVHPLKEFDLGSPLDYYQGINMAGMGGTGSLCSWYRFERGLNFENGTLGFGSPEASAQGIDAFIASFAAYHPVGVDEVETTGPGQGLLVIPTADDAVWSIHFPHEGKWRLAVHDATGRQVQLVHAAGQRMHLDLGTNAPGIYVLRALDGQGTSLSTKVLRP